MRTKRRASLVRELSPHARPTNREGETAERELSLSLRIFLIIFSILLPLWLRFVLLEQSPFNWFLTVAWGLYAPVVVMELLGLFSGKIRTPNPGISRKLVIFNITSIASREVFSSLVKVIDSCLLHAPRYLPNFRVDVVVDEGAECLEELRRRYAGEPRVNLIVVPKAFRTPKGTKFKARANHFAVLVRRERGENRDDCWIYYLDDDSIVGEDTIRGIAKFVEDGRKLLGQGVLLFRRGGSRLAHICDMLRTMVDLGAFRFFIGRLGMPLAGLHGEHLLVRSDVADEIGWDFGEGALTEDCEFAARFIKKYRGRAGFLPCCVRAQSPKAVSHLWRQRARWWWGTISLLLSRECPHLMRLVLGLRVASWSLSFFVHPFVLTPLILLFRLLTGNLLTPTVAHEAGTVLIVLNLSYIVYSYIQGSLLNERPSDPMKRLKIYISCSALSLLLTFIEGLSVPYALARYDRRKFEVIPKEA